MISQDEKEHRYRENTVDGSGYLGYVDSNQGYNPYKWVICPLTRVINLHITSYLPYPEPLSTVDGNQKSGDFENQLRDR